MNTNKQNLKPRTADSRLYSTYGKSIKSKTNINKIEPKAGDIAYRQV